MTKPYSALAHYTPACLIRLPTCHLKAAGSQAPVPAPQNAACRNPIPQSHVVQALSVAVAQILARFGSLCLRDKDALSQFLRQLCQSHPPQYAMLRTGMPDRHSRHSQHLRHSQANQEPGRVVHSTEFHVARRFGVLPRCMYSLAHLPKGLVHVCIYEAVFSM